jgi:hypothetical protein
LARSGDGGRKDLGVTVVYMLGTSMLPSMLSEKIDFMDAL